ncbi:MAG: hypothetical protein WC373_00730 [Smithella sp.]|jgi:hypothetical protein
MNTDLTTNTISSGTTGNFTIGWNDLWNTYHHYCYPTTIYQEDKTSKAFRIVKSLMDKKVIELKNIKEFVDTVDVIVREL